MEISEKNDNRQINEAVRGETEKKCVFLAKVFT